MQKQSSRLYYRGKDHKDIYFRENYHCAMYKYDELVWEKYLDGVWVYDTQIGSLIYRMKTLDPLKKEVKDQALTNAPNMTYSNRCYIVYSAYSVARFSEGLLISNAGGNRLTNCTSLISDKFQFSVALNDRILVCDNRILYELQYNKRDKVYELVETYSDGLPEGFSAYTFGMSGTYLVGSVYSSNFVKFMAFGKDNVFKEFESIQNVKAFSCVQDENKIYLLAFVSAQYYPYFDYPIVYIYDGIETTAIKLDLPGRWVSDAAMIKRGDEFVIYETHHDGISNYYAGIFFTKDFLSVKSTEFKKCTIYFENGFTVQNFSGFKTYHKVAFVADNTNETVDEDTYKLLLPVSAIKRQGAVYYDSGVIDNDRKDMCLPFEINGFDQKVFLTAYIDNLYFEDSDKNFGR